MSDGRELDEFEAALALMAIFGGETGPAEMVIGEWAWERAAELGQTAETLGDEALAWIENAAEREPSVGRVAVQVVSLKDSRMLAQRIVQGTFAGFPAAGLRQALHDLAPTHYATRTLVKIVTATMCDRADWFHVAHLEYLTPPTPTGAPAVDRPTILAWQAARAAAAGGLTYAKVREQLVEHCALMQVDLTAALNWLDGFQALGGLPHA